ncbi:hypothetical protein [Dyadobacter soli]|nr:hypothetical protein [Dyadobacter soli]
MKQQGERKAMAAKWIAKEMNATYALTSTIQLNKNQPPIKQNPKLNNIT